MTSLETSSVRFDLDGNGTAELTGWVGASDGLLAYDFNDDEYAANDNVILRKAAAA